ncbi:hypothetical protein CYMTET_45694, partial [Cymbomonas tetramitiformis]
GSERVQWGVWKAQWRSGRHTDGSESTSDSEGVGGVEGPRRGAGDRGQGRRIAQRRQLGADGCDGVGQEESAETQKAQGGSESTAGG